MKPTTLVFLLVTLTNGFSTCESAGAASISGTTIDAATKAAIERVEVSLISASGKTLNSLTDAKGTFEFSSLAAGEYLILADKDGFVHPKSVRNALGRPGIIVSVAKDTATAGVEVLLVRQANLMGRVYDEKGRPVYGARVRLLTLSSTDGVQQLHDIDPILAFETDDLGLFRLFWINPGKYYLRVNPPTGGTAGSPVFSSLYYPTGSDFSRAEVVEIVPGANIDLGSLILTSAPTNTIPGQITMPDGLAIPGEFTTFLRKDKDTYPGVPSGRVKYFIQGFRDRFEAEGLLPGNYELSVGTRRAGEWLFGETTFECCGRADALAVAIQLNHSLRGRIETAETAKDIKGFVELHSAGHPMKTPPPAQIQKDGSFEFPILSPGHYNLRLTNLLPNTYLSEVIVGGRTQPSNDLDLTSADNMLIRLRSDGATLEGHIVTSTEQPISSGVVVLINDDDHPLRYSRVDADRFGAFVAAGIAPGNYILFGWTELYDEPYKDPEFVDKNRSYGTKLSLSPQDHLKVNVTSMRP